MKSFFTELYHRLIKSYRSTLLGLAVSVATYLLLAAQQASNPYVKMIAVLVWVPFLAWKDKSVKDGTLANIIELQPPRGAVPMRTLLFIIAAGALCAGVAHAADAPNPGALAGAIASDPAAVPPDASPAPAPSQFGGCIGAKKNVCFAPSFSITIAAINLRTKVVEGAFHPGAGYGVTVNPGKWSSFGVDVGFTLDPGANQASASVLAKFFNGYFRAGYSKGFIGDTAPRVLFGTGLDIP